MVDRPSAFFITFSEAQGSAAVEYVDTGAAIGTGFLSHGMSGRVAGIAPKVWAVGQTLATVVARQTCVIREAPASKAELRCTEAYMTAYIFLIK
jgi:hypothetical protein